MSLLKNMMFGVGSMLLVTQNIDAQVKTKNFEAVFEMEYVSKLPLVDVEIKGKKYKFLFDTGAMSVIPRSLAKELALEIQDEIDIVDASGKEDKLKVYKLPSLKMAGVEFSDFNVVADDFAKEFPVSCIGFDGILGYNFLKDLSVKLDYKNKKLTLSDKTISHLGYKTIAIQFDEKHAPLIPFAFAFGDVFVGIDTGKNDGILLGDIQIAKLFHKYNYTSRKMLGTSSSSFNGVDTQRVLESFVVKDFSLDREIAIASCSVDVDTSGQFLVGNAFLENFDLIIDFKHKRAYMKPLFKEMNEEFENSFGFSLFWDEIQKLYISALEENSQAAINGLKIGDKVLSINDTDTLNFSAQEYCKMTSEDFFQTQNKLELIVQRDGSKILRKILSK